MLLVLLAVLGVSGVGMLYGTWLPWLFDLHRIAGFILVVLLPWKGGIAVRSLARGLRKTFDRSVTIFASLVLALSVLLIIFLASIWMGWLGPVQSLGQTMIAWHWILGLLILPLLAFHIWRRWPRPRREDLLARRSFLKLAGTVGAGILLNEMAVLLAAARSSEEQPRRFTGSRAFGIFSGNDFPITGEGIVEIDIETWRLHVTGAVTNPIALTYPNLLALKRQSITETLDCTSGWYSLQEWQGISLWDFLQQAGVDGQVAGVKLVSATGYQHSYPAIEARTILLATHVTGEVLDPRHGFPLRAVVPGRRGWFWVKWLSRIELLDNPLEVAGGILASPRETIRQW